MDMSKNRYHNKSPYSTLHPDARHWTRKGSSWKQKVGYDTEDEAWEFLKTHPKLIELGMTVYKCDVCNMYHCGHKYNNK